MIVNYSYHKCDYHYSLHYHYVLLIICFICRVLLLLCIKCIIIVSLGQGAAAAAEGRVAGVLADPVGVAARCFGSLRCSCSSPYHAYI